MKCNHRCIECFQNKRKCIHSPIISTEDRILSIFDNDSVEQTESEKKASGVYNQTPAVMLEFSRIGDSAY